MLEKLISEYQPGYSLHRDFYKDPDIYDAEIKNIFLKHWLFAGHTSQVPNPGDFFLFEFDKESIIIVRTKTGETKAFLNVCRHRGSHICLEKEGSTRAFTCPYHAWSYDLDGNLMSARLMDDDFEKSDNGLHRAHIELVGGLIFISLAENPLSLKTMQDDLSDVFEVYGFDHMKLAAQKSFPIAANWKLAVENYQECYHCAPSHQEFAKIHAMAGSPATFKKQKQKFLDQADPAIRTKESDCYFDFAKPGDEGYQYGRNPLLDGVKSGSLGGAPMAPFLGKITGYDGGASEFMVGPVNFFLIYNDHMVGYRFVPMTHNTCRCEIFWFVRDDAVEGKDYDLDKLTWLWDVTTQADEKIIINNKKGVDSHFYVPGRLSTMEYFEQSFITWYLKTLSEK